MRSCGEAGKFQKDDEQAWRDMAGRKGGAREVECYGHVFRELAAFEQAQPAPLISDVVFGMETSFRIFGEGIQAAFPVRGFSRFHVWDVLQGEHKVNKPNAGELPAEGNIVDANLVWVWLLESLGVYYRDLLLHEEWITISRVSRRFDVASVRTSWRSERMTFLVDLATSNVPSGLIYDIRYEYNNPIDFPEVK